MGDNCDLCCKCMVMNHIYVTKYIQSNYCKISYLDIQEMDDNKRNHNNHGMKYISSVTIDTISFENTNGVLSELEDFFLNDDLGNG